VEAIHAVLNQAIKAGGSSLRDHRQTSGELGYFQHFVSSLWSRRRELPDCGLRRDRAVGSPRTERCDLLVPEVPEVMQST